MSPTEVQPGDKKEYRFMPGILVKQVLVRMSAEEEELWVALAQSMGTNPSTMARRLIATVAGQPELIERIERQVADAKRGRAAHMRQFVRAVPAESDDEAHQKAG